MKEGRPIHRSSHALVDDLSDLDTDATSAADLFNRLKNEDCMVFAHIGGRYADIRIAHDQRLETAVEVHSAWGTFEWLIHDAFEQGYRVGIMANSDGHKGRPGASHPGATSFGAYGGLTCMLANELTRAGIMDCLRRRHHYGTTGCRLVLDTRVRFDQSAIPLDDQAQPASGASPAVTEAMMGDIVASEQSTVKFVVEVRGSAPVERIDIRNGMDTVEVYRPYTESDLGNRIRVIWEGSEYRGRGRETIWDGSALLTDNEFEEVTPINRYNLDKKFELLSPVCLEWEALTTGGFGGFEARLASPWEGYLQIDTPLVKEKIDIATIGLQEMIFENGGIDRRIRIYRLPEINPSDSVAIEREIALKRKEDNALYVRITQEDGHYAWSSPIYIIHHSR